MSQVTSTIRIDASPGEVWAVVMDPARLEQWVTIHRKLIDAYSGPPRKGTTMRQELILRGAHFKVSWRLAECETNQLAVWEGTGPARSRARTEYRLTPEDSGTRFDYDNEFRPPLGALGAVAGRALIGGLPQREAQRSLQMLKQIIEHP
ncbi:MAG: hypothetical protein E6G56_14235 [Actinobacteria bacterium]|nr:MAG: hypothetical protein E6G56_14235 [Actinomycetota bacterium]